MRSTKKLTHQEFVDRVRSATGEEYEVIGSYVNSSTLIELLHKSCGNIINIRPQDFKKGRRCGVCFGNKKKTTVDFSKEVFDVVGDEYTVMGEYKGNMKHIEMMHNTCNRTYSVSPSKFLHGRRCPLCANDNRYLRRSKKPEQFIIDLHNKHEGSIIALEDYKGKTFKILFKDVRCGHEWHSTPDIVVNSGSGCPTCSKSKGEQAIEKYLVDHSILYKPQYRFLDCKGKSAPLPFDFAVFKNNSGELDYLIEYDGIQHYEPKFGEVEFDRTQKNDKIKNLYCERKNIKLIRIPYYDSGNIEGILEEITMH